MMHGPHGYGAPSGYGPPSLRQEVPIFAAQGVQVTSARFVVGMKTYPIAAITSVAPLFFPPQTSGPVAAILFCSMGLLVSWGIYAIDGTWGATFAAIFAAGIVGGVFAYRAKKPGYGVLITTSGMNVQALTTWDGAFSQHVIGALNQAVSMR